MIDTVIGIKVRMSGLCINRYRPIIGQSLDNRPLPYRCISSSNHWAGLSHCSNKVRWCFCVTGRHSWMVQFTSRQKTQTAMTSRIMIIWVMTMTTTTTMKSDTVTDSVRICVDICVFCWVVVVYHAGHLCWSSTPTGVQAWRTCPLWEPSPGYPILE